MKGHSKITGTLTIHAVTSQQPGLLQTRQTSCFGSCCFDEGIFHCGCAGWTEQLVFDGLSETEGAVSVTRESEQAGLVAMETEPAAVETEQAEPAAVETEEAEFLETDAEQAESVTETEQAEPTMTETEQAEPTMTETEQAEPTMTEKEETEAPATEIEQAKVPETEQAQLPQTETEQAQLPQTETEQAQLPQTETEQAQLPQTEQPECVTKEHEQTELTLLIRQEENKKTELTERKTTEAEDGVQSNEIVTEKNEDYCYKVGDMGHIAQKCTIGPAGPLEIVKIKSCLSGLNFYSAVFVRPPAFCKHQLYCKIPTGSVFVHLLLKACFSGMT